MHINLFQGPRLKVERAKRHIQELHTLCSALIQRNPYVLVSDVDSEPGTIIIRVKVNEDVPADWGTIVGDIAHNLRSALDQLVCDLVVANGNTVGKSHSFLITGTRETFETHFPKKVKGISKRAEWLIRRLKPYARGYGDKAGCPVLHLLDWLDDLDKHQGIIVVGSAIPATRVITFFPPDRIPAADSEGRIDIRMPAMGNTAPKCPLENDMIIYKIARTGLKHEVQMAFTVAVAEAPVMQGQPIVEIMAQLAQLTEKTINIFERHART